VTRAFLVAALLGALACEAPHPDWSAQDGAVYAAVLDSLYLPETRDSTGDSARYVVVDDSIEPFPGGAPLLAEARTLAAPDTDLVLDMARRPVAPLPIDTLRAILRGRVRVAEPATWQRIETTRDSMARADTTFPIPLPGLHFWPAFATVYPRHAGSFTLYPVGYDRTGTSAIVYVRMGCGDLCGETRLVLLRRERDRWRVWRSRRLVVS
jgi:hypothetical protein